MSITISPAPITLTLKSNGKIKIIGFVTIKEHGETVASLDGEFDFASLPIEYHAIVASYLVNNKIKLVTGYTPLAISAKDSQVAVLPSTPASPMALSLEAKRWWQFWR